MASTIMELALHHKASRMNLADYTIADLERETNLNHSVIWRAVDFGIQREDVKHQPKLETVRKLAKTLEIETDPVIENLFYNAFGYASPHQVASVQTYVTQQGQKSP